MIICVICVLFLNYDYCSVITTFPFLRPVSTYRWASTNCSRGYTRSITGFMDPDPDSSVPEIFLLTKSIIRVAKQTQMAIYGWEA
jgi:hypothetical protein